MPLSPHHMVLNSVSTKDNIARREGGDDGIQIRLDHSE
jgi:hypothetical protein